MQQGGGGAGGSQFGISPSDMATYTTTAAASSTTAAAVTTSGMLQQQLKSGDHIVVEAASPISSRPPARPSNFDDLVTAAAASSGAGFPDDEGFGGDEGLERGGVGGGNRWPRQETMALLKIRSEMDVAFRDATLKGPLWEDVSRKLAQQGYTRSGKKCKEKFENVHKYYKRTKEGRAGRQDGKSYRFFSQLEALHAAPPTAATTNLAVALSTTAPGIGMVGAAPARPQGTTDPATSAAAPQIGGSVPMDISGGVQIGVPESSNTPTVPTPGGISFSSNTSSAESEDSDDDLLEAGGGGGLPSSTSTRKRKRGESSSGGGGVSGSSRRMMDFFEGLMKQVMEKQESMQQRFLETIEKREQDRMIREEAWKRQEMGRLAREHEIMAQERAISASRDAAIIAFLQKITGQQIQFPPPLIIPAAPSPAPPQPQHQPQPQPQPQRQPTPSPQAQPATPAQPLPQPQPQQTPPLQQQQQQQHHQQPQQQQKPQQHHALPPSQSTEIVRHQPTSTDIVAVAAIPEQQHPPQQEMVVASSGGGGGGFDSPSSRWPKQEVLALIKLRSGLESRYQEAGPKGPLWEEISTGMQRMGYNRSSKRCKEKWENINKYFKKVKESNKKRPEDAKTCPYFHQLDALYRKKMIGGSGSSSFGHQSKQDDPMAIERSPAPASFQAIMPPQPPQTTEAENKNNNVAGSVEQQEQQRSSKEGGQGQGQGQGQAMFEEGNSGTTLKKPEDIMKDLMDQHQLMANFDKLEEPDSDHIDQDDDEFEDDEEDDDDDDDEEASKMAYKIQFQRQNAAGSSSSNGGGNAPNSFLAMVQ